MKQKRALRRGWLRKFAALTALVTAVAGLNLVGPQEAQAANSPYVPARYRLVWSDEFEGNSLNASNWTPATGAWGDNMQMVYKDQPRNLYVKDGSLHLVAYREKNGVKTNVCGGQKVKTGKTASRPAVTPLPCCARATSSTSSTATTEARIKLA